MLLRFDDTKVGATRRGGDTDTARRLTNFSREEKNVSRNDVSTGDIPCF